jgi:hypothetical protein
MKQYGIAFVLLACLAIVSAFAQQSAGDMAVGGDFYASSRRFGARASRAYDRLWEVGPRFRYALDETVAVEPFALFGRRVQSDPDDFVDGISGDFAQTFLNGGIEVLATAYDDGFLRLAAGGQLLGDVGFEPTGTSSLDYSSWTDIGARLNGKLHVDLTPFDLFFVRVSHTLARLAVSQSSNTTDFGSESSFTGIVFYTLWDFGFSPTLSLFVEL